MAKIFINYRRADSITVAFIIYNKLTVKKHDVFIDKEAIPVGFDFAAFIKKKIATYDVMLALIGNQWTSLKGIDKKIRIKKPGDHVRLELAEGLTCNTLKVIPVLIDKVPFPAPEDLPYDLKSLGKLNAVDFLSYEYNKSAERILAEIERTLSLLTSKDLSKFITIISIADDRGVVRTLKAAMEANLLADIGVKTQINFEELDTTVEYVSKLKKGEGTFILSALYAAEQFGVLFTSWETNAKMNLTSGKKTSHTNGNLKRYTVGTIDDMITHLNANRPILAIVSIREAWMNLTTTDGLFLTPPAGHEIGNQAIIISQVDLVKNRIKFAMLWGKKWGSKGFGYFSEESFYLYVKQDLLYAIETTFIE
ncbi:MAG: TIR domain-containing protein [Chitinophagaceae bacterium]|nr:TIR domain-containing protein [Chitinophagaceae bacterium]